MNKSKPKPEQKRSPYQPPKVVAVSLRPEEAVLGHCKIVGSGGPVSGSCRSVVACKSLGS
jgi:hypothetical protein